MGCQMDMLDKISATRDVVASGLRGSLTATILYVQEKVGKKMSVSEYVALAVLFESNGKPVPCAYCFVNYPIVES